MKRQRRQLHDNKDLLIYFINRKLQFPKVQQASFGRLLKCTRMRLFGYKSEKVGIKDKGVIQLSEQKHHPIAIISTSSTDFVDGILFEITIQDWNNLKSMKLMTTKELLSNLRTVILPGFIFTLDKVL